MARKKLSEAERLDEVLPLYGSVRAQFMKERQRVKITNRDRERSVIVSFETAMKGVPELRSAVEESTRQGRVFSRYIIGHDKTLIRRKY